MAQAREAEKKTNFKLVGTDTGEKYSKGETVILEDIPYKLNWLARHFETQLSSRLFIVLFLIFYLIIIYTNQNFIKISTQRSENFHRSQSHKTQTGQKAIMHIKTNFGY